MPNYVALRRKSFVLVGFIFFPFAPFQFHIKFFPSAWWLSAFITITYGLPIFNILATALSYSMALRVYTIFPNICVIDLYRGPHEALQFLCDISEADVSLSWDY